MNMHHCTCGTLSQHSQATYFPSKKQHQNLKFQGLRIFSIFKKKRFAVVTVVRQKSVVELSHSCIKGSWYRQVRRGRKFRILRYPKCTTSFMKTYLLQHKSAYRKVFVMCYRNLRVLRDSTYSGLLAYIVYASNPLYRCR